jgi:hypothetical protein
MNKDVPYIAFEAEQMRADRRDRRRAIIEIVLIVSLLASNAFWVFKFNQYETVEKTDTVQQTIEADDGSDASAYIGEVNYGGESNAEDNKNDESTSEEVHR